MASTTFFFGNAVINSAFIAWFVAQFIKVLISLFKGEFDISRMTGAGGMPSSHSSTMIALTTSIGMISGLESSEFAIALVMSGVVMYDAAGVRRAAGEQAKALNHMMKQLSEFKADAFKTEEFKKELKELLGHTPLEVIAGAFLGLIIGLIVTTL